MNSPTTTSLPIADYSLWERLDKKRHPASFDIELTARCPNNCRHCYINLPAGDTSAMAKEMPLEKIMEIADGAVSLGTLWCLLTGGEPFLRKDFNDIYVNLKKKGFLLSVFTTATLISDEHIRMFGAYPPRDIEVSVYGVTKETYERVTRKKGSFDAFMRGVTKLFDAGIKVRFKAMALRSNLHEMPMISKFCREHTKDHFRFDPLLHLRLDGDPARNEEIREERLTPEEIVALEKSDHTRMNILEKECRDIVNYTFSERTDKYLFSCATGNKGFTVSYDGHFKLCSSLSRPDCVFDLNTGSLADAWNNFAPRIRSKQTERKKFLESCHICHLYNLCLWCPAHAALETGELDLPIDYFCRVAHARAEMLKIPDAGDAEMAATGI